MFYYEGQSCPTCGRAFTPQDDVVSCPVCGLPHHRACWNEEGHCHLEHLHGTSEQWTRQKTEEPVSTTTSPKNICAQCGTANPEYAEYCQHCGTPLNSTDWSSAGNGSFNEYTPFTHTSHPSDEPVELIDGVRSDELMAMTGATKADYYLTRFKRIADGGAGGWNWAAFILAPYWLLYRKMYKYGILLLLYQTFENLVSLFVLGQLGFQEFSADEINQIAANMMQDRSTMLYFAAVYLIGGIFLILRILLVVFGNKLYFHHCKAKIEKVKTDAPDLSAGEMMSLGGVSYGIPIIAYFVCDFILKIIQLFL